ncbi:hypothetical protein [Halorussus litoreus]|uniref:hypothetical protein n=1 Tax=Halorussus litoreus TaxID=1710536 RepID=UPI000E281CA1|nr:hypothetical protein [Halorussus litoreus]
MSGMFGRTAMAAAWLAGGGVLAALGLWYWADSPEGGQFVRFGIVWGLFGVAQLAMVTGWYPSWADRRVEGWSRVRTGLLGAGVALLLLGFVLSGPFLLGFGAGGLLLVAITVLADR